MPMVVCVREKPFHQRGGGAAAILRQGHVLLLIDGLQLRVEKAEHRVLEAVGLDDQVVLQLVGGDVLVIVGEVDPGGGVGATGADQGHQLVVLVRDGEGGGQLRNAVNLFVDGLALSGLDSSIFRYCSNSCSIWSR